MKVKNSTVVVKSGDICSTACDVIVSSDDSWLSQSGGVSMAIARAGGDAIRADTRKLVPAELGDAVVTSGGKLRQKYIFHAVTIDTKHCHDMASENRMTLQSFIVQNSMKRCFQLLADLKMNSIAFPLIGSGVARIPMKAVVENMASVLIEELGKTNRRLKVELWTFDRPHTVVEQMLRAALDGKVKTAGSAMVAATVIGSVIGGPVIGSILGLGVKKLLERKTGGTEKKRLSAKKEDGLNCATSVPCGQTHKVFVSYSRKDLTVARDLCQFFEQERIPYWIDLKRIPVGEDYKRKITRAIREATFLLFLSSKASNASSNVQKEIALAVAEDKRIIPLRLDNTPYDDAIAYDITALDFVEWNGDKEYAKWKLRNVLMSGLVNQNLIDSFQES